MGSKSEEVKPRRQHGVAVSIMVMSCAGDDGCVYSGTKILPLVRKLQRRYAIPWTTVIPRHHLFVLFPLTGETGEVFLVQTPQINPFMLK